jgi:uncharacterized protein
MQHPTFKITAAATAAEAVFGPAKLDAMLNALQVSCSAAVATAACLTPGALSSKTILMQTCAAARTYNIVLIDCIVM